MELLVAQALTKGFGGAPVVEQATLRILEGDAIGLVGPNGTGKTTLARLLAGSETPDRGRVDRRKGLRVGFVEQVPVIGEAESVADLLLRSVRPAQAELEAAEAALAAATGDGVDRRLADYERATERFEAAGGYDALERGLATVSALGLDAGPDQPLATLSGGELSLLTFAQALIGRPDLLILDEPGNHLDFLGLAWLEQFLAGYPGSFLAISHNRYLLDVVCRTIWHLERGELTTFSGSYTAFRAERERLRAEREHEFRANDRKAQELEQRVKELRSITSSQYNPPAQITRKLGAAKRKLEETIEARGERPPADRAPEVELGPASSKADIAISFSDLDLTAGELSLLRAASLHITCGERVALVGPNGCGKSTLLERIVTEGGWDSGPIRVGPSLTVGYLSQLPRFNHPEGTILEEVRSWGPLSVDQAFGVVAPLLFGYEEMGKRIAVLSGGEQNRLQFARLVYEGANLLILDEPTNHLDIPSREAIEAALADFAGTLLVVSHDRYFLNNLVERVIAFDGNALVSYDGNFSAYFAARYAELPRLSGSLVRRGAERRSALTNRPAVPESSPAPSESPSSGLGSPRASEKQQPVARSKRTGGTDWESTIHRLEVERATLEVELADSPPDSDQSRRLHDRLTLLSERIDRAYQHWMESEG